MKIYTVNSVAEIDEHVWNNLANSKKTSPDFQYNPFLNWHFFYALEKSRSATARTGWLPMHLIAEQATEIVGILPCYLKNHSQGEYVFDYAWADALESIGENYYPKIQCSVPFTPVNGRRIFAKDNNEKIIFALANELKIICQKINASSVHITFVDPQQCALLEKSDFLIRHGQQFHWQNNGYETFDDFLQSLNSRKRKTIKRERTDATRNGEIEIEWLHGIEITPAIWARFFEFYQDTSARKWGQPYLTFEFFQLVSKTMAKDILMILAKRRNEYIAGALNFVGSHTLFGRYWGCIEDHPFLHFEICYYQAIEYAIKYKLQTVEAGAQGGHKVPRGYAPTLTLSAHYILHKKLQHAISVFLQHEQQQVEKHNKIITQHLPFKQGVDNGK